MKKFKLSWQHFLMSILVILVLGALVYYLEQKKVLEGLKNIAHSDSTDPPPTTNGDETTKKKKKTGADANIPKNGKSEMPKKIHNDIRRAPITQATVPGPRMSQNSVEAKNKIQSTTKTSKKEGFSNLNYAPVSASGPKASCPDPLKPYQNYKCGPTNVNNFFGGMEFKPECCGNPAGSSYSNSVGCACICPEQWTYLNSRGGNRSFPTEF